MAGQLTPLNNPPSQPCPRVEMRVPDSRCAWCANGPSARFPRRTIRRLEIVVCLASVFQAGEGLGFGRPQGCLDLNPQGSKKVRRSPADMGNIPLFTGFYTSQVVRELLVFRNPAPVNVWVIPLFTGFGIHPRWLFGISSINSST